MYICYPNRLCGKTNLVGKRYFAVAKIGSCDHLFWVWLRPKNATILNQFNDGREKEHVMARGKLSLILVAATLTISGCSTRPRYFVATISPPAANVKAFDNDMLICRELVGRGYKSNFKAQAASIGLGTATGTVLTAVAVNVALSSGFLTTTGTSAAANALAVGAPIIGAAVGFGVSRIIRSGREKKLKTGLSDCLTEYGYTAVKWTPAKRPKLPSASKKMPAAKDTVSYPS